MHPWRFRKVVHPVGTALSWPLVSRLVGVAMARLSFDTRRSHYRFVASSVGVARTVDTVLQTVQVTDTVDRTATTIE